MSTASGILLVDKPHALTSHDVVARIRKRAATRKVGHAGTLDPMATGLLVLGIGSSTRLLTYVVGADKQYEATIRLGASTTTDDAEGDIVESASAERIAAVTPDSLHAGIASLTGVIDQVPSSVSAIKVDGKRAYARVRAGEEVVLTARTVTVSAFTVLGTCSTEAGTDVAVRVDCSSGTYVRALARDLGARLGVGGHLVALRRIRVGPFDVADAAELETVDVAERLMSPATAAASLFETLELSAQQSIDLMHGKRIRVDRAAHSGPIAAIAPDGRLVGLVKIADGRAVSLVNFPADETGARS